MKRRGRDRSSQSFSEDGQESTGEEAAPQTTQRRSRERQTSLSQKDAVATAGSAAAAAPTSGMAAAAEDREELDFQFDEELDNPLPAVKQNTFSEWSDSESECEEVGDDFINKVRFHLLKCRSWCPIRLVAGLHI